MAVAVLDVVAGHDGRHGVEQLRVVRHLLVEGAARRGGGDRHRVPSGAQPAEQLERAGPRRDGRVERLDRLKVLRHVRRRGQLVGERRRARGEHVPRPVLGLRPHDLRVQLPREVAAAPLERLCERNVRGALVVDQRAIEVEDDAFGLHHRRTIRRRGGRRRRCAWAARRRRWCAAPVEVVRRWRCAPPHRAPELARGCVVGGVAGYDG